MKQRETAKRKTSPSYIVLTAILMMVAVVQIFPFYWMLTFSLKSNNEIYGGNIAGLPKTLHFENYVKAFSTGNIGVYLKNSIIVTVVTIIEAVPSFFSFGRNRCRATSRYRMIP